MGLQNISKFTKKTPESFQNCQQIVKMADSKAQNMEKHIFQQKMYKICPIIGCKVVPYSRSAAQTL